MENIEKKGYPLMLPDEQRNSTTLFSNQESLLLEKSDFGLNEIYPDPIESSLDNILDTIDQRNTLIRSIFVIEEENTSSSLNSNNNDNDNNNNTKSLTISTEDSIQQKFNSMNENYKNTCSGGTDGGVLLFQSTESECFSPRSFTSPESRNSSEFSSPTPQYRFSNKSSPTTKLQCSPLHPSRFRTPSSKRVQYDGIHHPPPLILNDSVTKELNNETISASTTAATTINETIPTIRNINTTKTTSNVNTTTTTTTTSSTIPTTSSTIIEEREHIQSDLLNKQLTDRNVQISRAVDLVVEQIRYQIRSDIDRTIDECMNRLRDTLHMRLQHFSPTQAISTMS